MKSKVYLEKCEKYDISEIESILRPIISEIKEEENIFKKDDRVFLKVNLLTDKRPDQFTTTHPFFTQAIIHILKDYGVRMIVGDSSSGRFNEKALKHLYEATGYLKMCEEEDVPLNYDTDTITINGIPQVKAMHEVDYLLDLCKLKSHSMATFTGATKNVYGSVPGEIKAVQHAFHPNIRSFARYICDICEILKPRVSLMDGIEGMCHNGPSNGEKFESHIIGVSVNPYALDRQITDLLLIPAQLLPIDAEARKRGLYDEIELISSKSHDELIMKGFILPDSVNRKNVPYPSFDSDICVGCGRCALSCPQKTISLKEGKATFDRTKCIRCYCCQEVCPANAIKLV